MIINADSIDAPKEEISITTDETNLDFVTARDLAKEKARAVNADAMLLSWHNGETGEFYPKYDCGPGFEAPWVVFAEARGGNLVIDINNGAFTFIFLKL